MWETNILIWDQIARNTCNFSPNWIMFISNPGVWRLKWIFGAERRRAVIEFIRGIKVNWGIAVTSPHAALWDCCLRVPWCIWTQLSTCVNQGTRSARQNGMFFWIDTKKPRECLSSTATVWAQNGRVHRPPCCTGESRRWSKGIPSPQKDPSSQSAKNYPRNLKCWRLELQDWWQREFGDGTRARSSGFAPSAAQNERSQCVDHGSSPSWSVRTLKREVTNLSVEPRPEAVFTVSSIESVKPVKNHDTRQEI